MNIEQVANYIASIKCTHPLRVAVDGVDAAGKTMFANKLAVPLERLGRQVIRASVDGFHHPRSVRYQRGQDSAAGYFFDSFDYAALKTVLLEPLGPGGNLEYQTAVFDFRTDAQVHAPTYDASPDAILLFDGVFLLRPELVDCWEFAIFLDVDFDVAGERAACRDSTLFGSVEKAKERYRKRYVPGQKLYLSTCQPQRHAHLIIDNNDPMNPRII